jgi:hypothetical protein
VNPFCPNTGKVQYESKEDTEYAIPKLSRKYGNVGEPYYCIYCDKWHLGKKPRKKKRKRG